MNVTKLPDPLPNVHQCGCGSQAFHLCADGRVVCLQCRYIIEPLEVKVRTADANRQEPVGELRDWIDLLELLPTKGEFLVGQQLTDLAAYLKTLGDRQIMREALLVILSESGLDDALVKGANHVVFARMGSIHQSADYALGECQAPSVATEDAIMAAAREITETHLFVGRAVTRHEQIEEQSISDIIRKHLGERK